MAQVFYCDFFKTGETVLLETALASHWLNTEGDVDFYDNADLNFDQQINMEDFVILSGNWLIGLP